MIRNIYLKFKIRILSGSVMLIISLAIILWQGFPSAMQSQVFNLPLIEIFNFDNKNDGTFTSISLEQYRIKLTWPVRVYSGKNETIFLDLIASEPEMNPGEKESGIMNGDGSDERTDMIYESYNLVAEARIDLSGVEINPKEEISQPMPEGKSLSFRWRITPDHDDTFSGMFWFYINFVSKYGGVIDRRALLAFPIEITGYSFFGLSRSTLLGISAVLFLASFVLWYRPFEYIFIQVCGISRKI
ncbi:MAG: hypothetical protein MUO76_18035 [Anaerolineaceae bacterium]|nr:hypothetical protein [Anaerolineaceae bacterium]